MGATLTLNGLAFPNANTGGLPDAQGCRWYYAVDGWDAPGTRGEVLTRPGVHGGLPGEWVYEPRGLVWRGFAYCPSESALWEAADRVNRYADATEEPVYFQVATPLRTLRCTVWRDGKANLYPRTDRVLDFSVPFTALDPRKYALVEASWGPVDANPSHDDTLATMVGNVRRVPIRRLSVVGGAGGASNARFANRSDLLALFGYDRAIAAGETVVFDFGTQTATSSIAGDTTGSIRTDAVWPDMLRGANDLLVYTDSGRLTATVYWMDGWL